MKRIGRGLGKVTGNLLGELVLETETHEKKKNIPLELFYDFMSTLFRTL